MEREVSDLVADPQQEADERGLVLVLPDPFELFLDIDDQDSLRNYQAMLLVLAENQSGPPLVTEAKRTTSPGGNTHVYLRFARPLSDLERVAFQACLGSDRKRELLSLLRIEFCLARPPTVFFETPQGATH